LAIAFGTRTLAARRNRSDDHALSDGVSGDAGTDLVNRPHRLVADHPALFDWIFTFQDMDVGSADRRGGDLQEDLAKPDAGDGNLLQDDAILFDEHGGFHGLHATHGLQAVLPARACSISSCSLPPRSEIPGPNSVGGQHITCEAASRQERSRGGQFMKMVRRDPFRELEDMSTRLNRYFGRNYPATTGGEDEAMMVADWMPIVDIKETPEELLIKGRAS
jgi:hypothetical protein